MHALIVEVRESSSLLKSPVCWAFRCCIQRFQSRTSSETLSLTHSPPLAPSYPSLFLIPLISCHFISIGDV
ncbi:hypothetical protein CPAR01_01728 [Colletotrichum paranaense]|uniref:Uncharacterized protein n=1 Tax=Colletotrichum paranaense TaxID=1914294 RepID=A0ABQ9T9A4_9PEZI|nr:uncharacterized protein CPAR01_01728 [Colletotrichum paranaense]KAK1547761.1 hypothetical protein CPAR01_01728 [Colletotrichum paranaense]